MFPATMHHPIKSILGHQITLSPAACEMREVFPDKPRTKRRLRRTLAKFGRTQYMHPMAYNTPNGIIMHPTIYAALETANQRIASQKGDF